MTKDKMSFNILTNCCTPSPKEIDHSQLPIAIIGAGPIGLAAAAHLVAKNVSFMIFESGHTSGATSYNGDTSAYSHHGNTILIKWHSHYWKRATGKHRS